MSTCPFCRLLCTLTDYVDVSQNSKSIDALTQATKDKGIHTVKDPSKVPELLASQLPGFASLAPSSGMDAAVSVADEKLRVLEMSFAPPDASAGSSGTGSITNPSPEDPRKKKRFDVDAATVALQARAFRELSSVVSSASSIEKEAKETWGISLALAALALSLSLSYSFGSFLLSCYVTV